MIFTNSQISGPKLLIIGFIFMFILPKFASSIYCYVCTSEALGCRRFVLKECTKENILQTKVALGDIVADWPVNPKSRVSCFSAIIYSYEFGLTHEYKGCFQGDFIPCKVGSSKRNAMALCSICYKDECNAANHHVQLNIYHLLAIQILVNVMFQFEIDL